MTSSAKLRRWFCAVAAPVLITAALPLQAAADQNFGAGVLSGTVNYSVGGVPTNPLGNCVNVTWTMDTATIAGVPAAAVVVDFLNDAYAGPVTITSTGSSCAAMWAEGGNVSATIAGTGPKGSLTCSTMSGIYQRVGTDVVLVLTGSCSVDLHPSGFARVVVTGPFAPTTFTTDHSEVTGGDFVGGFTLEPL